MFAQTYKSILCPKVARQWKDSLISTGKSRAASVLCLPHLGGEGDVDAFPDWEMYLQVEQGGVEFSELTVDGVVRYEEE